MPVSSLIISLLTTHAAFGSSWLLNQGSFTCGDASYEAADVESTFAWGVLLPENAHLVDAPSAESCHHRRSAPTDTAQNGVAAAARRLLARIDGRSLPMPSMQDAHNGAAPEGHTVEKEPPYTFGFFYKLVDHAHIYLPCERVAMSVVAHCCYDLAKYWTTSLAPPYAADGGEGNDTMPISPATAMMTSGAAQLDFLACDGNNIYLD